MNNTPIIAGKTPKVVPLEAGTYYWCTCGKSANQPFCDGAHTGGNFTPQEFIIKEAETVALCQCKHSKNTPFCDGEHRNLQGDCIKKI